ncbi:charged multivesicular body protein 4C [Penicillium lagena]|uniref:charged multivesicular body protein 4C n=1 Tax=Penicillium lagena TaxID=94218 RepID=UPI002542253F|nr:charged multivesicular body protein 4C [Penicillium lagena]KAJ5625885.1 charged multivesicular body protein 4C [Penicillium lagena]
MWSWFGGAAAQKRKEAPKNAILLLREQLDMLQKREKYLDHQMEEQDSVARKNVNSNKNAAKAALRRKKVHEKNLEQTTAQIMQLEQQIYSIEAANINHETFKAMQEAGKAMSQIHNGMTIDKVDKTMEDLQEQHQLGQDIGEVIAHGHVGYELPDEDELEAELESMEQEAMDERMLHTGSVPVAVSQLPSPATQEPKQQTKPEEDDEEAELAKLRAEMEITM